VVAIISPAITLAIVVRAAKPKTMPMIA